MCLGVPGQIVEIVDAARNLAKADFAGVRRTVNVACIVTDDRPAEACLGDWVLVHVGFAMSRIDEAEAKATLAMFESLELAEDLGRDQTATHAVERSK
jgi:hydrogenase expression/formation protein HypC